MAPLLIPLSIREAEKWKAGPWVAQTHILGHMNIILSFFFFYSSQRISSRLQIPVKYVPTPPALGV